MTRDESLHLLTGAGVPTLLGELLGEPVEQWRARQVDHRPGERTTAAYEATVRGSRVLVGADVVAGARPRVWRLPDDPELPALAVAADDARVRELLATLGIVGVQPTLRVVSYRPRRRGVVEVRAPRCRLFLKVVRPAAVEALHRRHVLLRGAGLPVPRSLGWTDSGLLVMEALAGTYLRTRVRHGGVVPAAAQVVALLDRFPAEVAGLPRRRSWVDAVDHYARVVGSALPAEGARADELAAEVQALVDTTTPGSEPTHGDLYDAQLLLHDQRITGLLDVDAAGPGRRADDLATLLAHLLVLDGGARVVERWEPELAVAVSRRELRARVAGVLVSLATGPHRVQAPGWEDTTRARLELAEQWLRRARGA